MNTLFMIIDVAMAMTYSSLTYLVGRACIYFPDPRWSAEQAHANREAWRGCFLAMALTTTSSLAIIPMAILMEPFWGGPWWGYAAAVTTVCLAIALPIVKRALRDITAQRYRLIG